MLSKPQFPCRDAEFKRQKKKATSSAVVPESSRESELDDSSAGIGPRLRYVRELFGLSQRELARRSGLTHGTVGGIERDAISPSVGSLRKILDSLPMTLSEFFSLDPENDTQVFFVTRNCWKWAVRDCLCAKLGATSQVDLCRFSWNTTNQMLRRLGLLRPFGGRRRRCYQGET